MPPGAHPLWSNLFRPRADRVSEATQLWRKTPLFEGIPVRQCRALVSEMHFRSFETDEPVFNWGDMGAGAVLIRTGGVAIRAGERTLAELTTGDFLGEVALVSDENRTADAVCTEPSELIFFLRANLEEWIQRSPENGARFMANLARVLAERMRYTNELLSEDHRKHGDAS